MKTIKLGDTGAAVEDVQQRLQLIGLLPEDAVSGVYDEQTAAAVKAFAAKWHYESSDVVNEKVWALLVDASFSLGDRTLYLRMPYFHGHDVYELQHALGALGFVCGDEDGIFGAHTELAVRKFQMNLGLPSDGIAGAYTFSAIRNLEHSWSGKDQPHLPRPLGFARAADVLEAHAVCLFGTDAFSRKVASRMSNLSQATNPASKIVSADMLSVAPDENMLLAHITLATQKAEAHVPHVAYADENTLSLRLRSAIEAARAPHATPARIVVVLPGDTWEDAGEDRSAQHFAITLLDALCAAL